jgi:hypothetical protein
MTWLDAPGVERRPLVFVEDHLHHSSELLAALAAAAPDLLSQATVCSVDRAGPDTSATVAEWVRRHPGLQVAALADGGERVAPLAPADLADAAAFARLVARLLRPGGILVQDVQLSGLAFLPADRWWESIYLAATVRGLSPDRPPTVRFISNKRGYAATFGRDLLEAGFDPRDVMDKSALASSVVPTIAALVDRLLPFTLDVAFAGGMRRTFRVADNDAERRDIEATLDLVLWPTPAGLELGGRLVGGPSRIALRKSGPEADTWTRLIRDRLGGGAGLAVLGVGDRIGPPDANRAELTNLAARHIHTLRSRLSDASAIATVQHTYRLHERTGVGLVHTATG